MLPFTFNKELLIGLVWGFILCSLLGWVDLSAVARCRPCAQGPGGAEAVLAASFPAAARPAPPPAPSAAALAAPPPRQPWLGSISPLLMHLRCGVESYGVPNVLVNNGVTGRIVVDVGMNAGEDFTIPAAVSGHKVYAFEPVRRKFAHVQQALRAVNATFDEYDPSAAVRGAGGGPLPPPPTSPAAVTMVWAAVGSTPGFVSMKEHPEDGSMDHVNAGAGGNVPIVPLSAIIPLESRIYLLKVDTEGHDGLAIQGADAWLRRGGVDFVYFEMNPLLMQRAGQSAVATLDYLAGHKYVCMEASLSSTNQPYLLRTTAAAEYIEHRLPWFGKPFYAGSTFTNVLCMHQSWLFATEVREGGSDAKDQSNKVADLG